MLELIRFVLSALFTLAGLFVLVSGVVGVFRFRYSMNRMHAAALGDTLGILCVLLGVMIAEGLTIATVKMLLVIITLWLTSRWLLTWSAAWRLPSTIIWSVT